MKRKKISEIRWENFHSAACLLDAAYYVYHAVCFESSISIEIAKRELDAAWKAWSVNQWRKMREHADLALKEIRDALAVADRAETLKGAFTKILKQAVSHIDTAIGKG
ncbi:MAG: hypothetical protein PUC15_08175 [Lentisphaeria bacterium]|nr:hypothetical protein [Lentisphaeria bacterium]